MTAWCLHRRHRHDEGTGNELGAEPCSRLRRSRRSITDGRRQSPGRRVHFINWATTDDRGLGGGGGGGASNTGAGRLCDVPSGTPRTSHQSESEKKKSILHQATLTGSPLDFSFRPDFPVDQLDLNSSWNGLQMPDNSHTQQFDISKFLDHLLITPLLKGFLKNPECRLFH